MAGRAGRVWKMVRVYRQFRRETRPGSDDRLHHHPGAPSDGWRERGTHKEGFGRSKGGFTTMLHLIANAHGLSVRAEVSGGEVSDLAAPPSGLKASMRWSMKIFPRRKSSSRIVDTTAITFAGRLNSQVEHPLFLARSTENNQSLSMALRMPCGTVSSAASTNSNARAA